MSNDEHHQEPSRQLRPEDRRKVGIDGQKAYRTAQAKTLMSVGIIGSIVVAAAGLALAVTNIGMYPFYWYSGIGWSQYYVTIPGIILAVGMLLLSLTFLGFYINHRSQLGLATFILSLFVSVFFVIAMALVLVDFHYGDLAFLRPQMAFLLMAILILLVGASMVVDGRRFPRQSRFLLSGILFIVAGTLTLASPTRIGIGWILLFLAGIFSALGLKESLPVLGKALPRPPVLVHPKLGDVGGNHSEFMFCPDCGKRTYSSRFCPYCGREMRFDS